MWRPFAERDFHLEGFCERLFPTEGFVRGGISPHSRIDVLILREARFKNSLFLPKMQLKNCPFNFIILKFLYMYLSHIMRKRSQKS